jgi:hypothetical protein
MFLHIAHTPKYLSHTWRFEKWPCSILRGIILPFISCIYPMFLARKYKTVVSWTYLKGLAATPMCLPILSLMVLTAIISHVTPTAPLFGWLRAHGASFVYHRVLKCYMMLDYMCGINLPKHLSDGHYMQRMFVRYVGSRIQDLNFGTLCTNYLGVRWCSWLGRCASSQTVAASIFDGVFRIFHWLNL